MWEGLWKEDGYRQDDEIAEEEKVASGPEAAALMSSVVEQFDNYAKLNKKLPAETPVQLSEIDEAARLADAVAANISVKVADKQSLLVESDPVKRLEMVFAFMEGELGVLQVERKIRSEEHTSELQSLMRITYAVVCL